MSLVHDALHDEYLGNDDDGHADTKVSHIVLAIELLDFHMKTHARTQWISLLTAGQDEKSLCSQKEKCLDAFNCAVP